MSNNIFPVINNLNDLKSKFFDKEEIRFAMQQNETTVVCYMIASESTFDSKEARECRGLVFDSNFNIISRPLHKFFNVGEREETRVENLNWSQIDRVMYKMDGSMIHTVNMKDSPEKSLFSTDDDVYQFDIKTKKSFTSDVANEARSFMKTSRSHIRACEAAIDKNQTLIFEYTAPTSRIVLSYITASLTLLHIRDNVTGKYLSQNELEDFASSYSISLVALAPQNVIDYIKADPYAFSKTVEGIEGVVIQFKNGEMVKLKTEWYIKRHKCLTFLRIRDIAELTLDEGLDDVKSMLIESGANIQKIIDIERDVVKSLNQISKDVEEQVVLLKDTSFKDAALYLKKLDTPLFGHIMSKLRGNEPNYIDWFKKYKLREYPLTQISYGGVDE